MTQISQTHRAKGGSSTNISLPRLTIANAVSDERRHSISSLNVQKAKVKYPHFSNRRQSLDVEYELERMRKPSAEFDSSGDSVKIFQELLRDEVDDRSRKEELVMLKRVGVNTTLPKSKFTKEQLVGEQAVKAFYERYKNIGRLHEKELYQGKQNPITFILSVLDAYNLPPKRMEIIKLKGDNAILDLRNCGIGRGPTGRIVSELVGQLGHFESIDLSFNQIGQDSAEALIPSLGILKSVCLSNNKIGRSGCQLISDLFRNPACRLTDLELQSNQLNEAFAIVLLDNLPTYGRLRLLNLSKNLLGNVFALKLKKYLQQDHCLQELYLHWNEFTDKSGKYIFQAIANHPTLKVLDVSWNALTGRDAANSICSFFKTNKVMLHLDLSFCDFNLEESLKLSAALQSNTSIYGLHFQGNMGYVDHRGGLVCEANRVVQYPIPIKRGVLRRIHGLNVSNQRNEFKAAQNEDVCWICHGWQEVYFRMPRPAGFTGDCFLHLDFQNFGAIKLQSQGPYFDTVRMCPVGPIKFYFTLSPPNRQTTSNYHDTADTESPRKPGLELNQQAVEWSDGLFGEDLTVNCRCLPRSEVHVLPDIKLQQVVVKPQVVKVPEPIIKQKQMGTKKTEIKRKRKVLREQKVNYTPRQVRTLGSPQQSLLYNKRSRTDADFIKQCIEFDLANSRILRVISKPQDQKRFRELMLQNYLIFKTAYYYLCNSNVSLTGMYSVSDFNVQQFVAEQKYESKRVTLAKIMLKLITCLTADDKKKEKTDKEKPDKLVNRPQFLEFLVRLAQEKWCVFVPPTKTDKDKDKEASPSKSPTKAGKQPKQQQSPGPKQPKQPQLKPESPDKPREQQPGDEEEGGEQPGKKIVLPLPLMAAIERMIKSVAKYSNRINPDYWRTKKYLTVDCESVFKGYEMFIQALYDRFAGSRSKLIKGPKQLTVDEFKDLFLNVDFRKTSVGLKECEDCFMDAKIMEVEEGIKPPTLDLMQFVEAFARYADKVSLAPAKTDKDPLWAKQQLRKKVPLFLKFQALLLFVYRRIPQLQTKQLTKFAQFGLFPQQSDALLEIFRASQSDLAKTSSRFLRTGFKLNTLFNLEDITLSTLVSYLDDKYRDRVVIREDEIEQVEEIEEMIELPG